VTDRSFDPRREIVLESPPEFPRGSPSAQAAGRTRAVFEWHGTQAATVRVNTPHRSVVLIRNTYDPGWHATVDGKPAALQPADYIGQGVPVPAGSHVVELTYDDPTIGFGLLGSATAIAVLLGVALVARRV
jgi:uncharacterized membrane protein YfhO